MARLWMIVIMVAASLSPARGVPPAWRFDVRPLDGARVVAVDAWYAADCPREISVSDGAEPYVDEVRVERASGWKALPRTGTSWFLPEGTTHVRYLFRLREAAERMPGPDAQLHGDVVECLPGVFLLHPLRMSAGRAYRLRVRATPEVQFVSGLWPTADGGCQSDVSDVSNGARVAFGSLEVVPLKVGDARLVLAFPHEGLPLDVDELTAWVQRKADAVAAYYGRFPVPRALVLITAGGDEGVSGHTEGGGGASVVLRVGRGVKPQILLDDWVITHEMVHLAFPGVRRVHHWIEEGLATYVEPILRARVGDLPAQKVWGDMAHDMPRGLPGTADQGLDHTHTWARTYWGGALFCFMADVQIRRETGGRRSLDDALRGILEAGGDITREWPLQAALEAGDRATGTRVLQRLYAEWGDTPVHVDLDLWWRRLGVTLERGEVRFDEEAPLAPMRRAITGL